MPLAERGWRGMAMYEAPAPAVAAAPAPAPAPPKPRSAVVRDPKLAVRVALRAWEQAFTQQHGRPATKADIPNHLSTCPRPLSILRTCPCVVFQCATCRSILASRAPAFSRTRCPRSRRNGAPSAAGRRGAARTQGWRRTHANTHALR